MRSEKDRRLVQVSVAIGLITTNGGVMTQIWERVGSQLLHRVIGGPMQFTLVLYRGAAAFFSIRSGLADAKAGKPPYFWGLLSDSGQRADMLKDGWKSVGRVFIFAMVLDAVYQIIVLRFVYPGEMIIVASILAIVPYLIVRGLVTRVARGKKVAAPMPATEANTPPPPLRKVS